MYGKKNSLEEKKRKSNLNDSASKGETSQQGVPFPIDGVRDFDDWSIISESSSKIRIKQVTIYADYYLCAFEIVYVDLDGNEKKSVHALDDAYRKQPGSIKKCQLDIDEDDYIDYIS